MTRTRSRPPRPARRGPGRGRPPGRRRHPRRPLGARRGPRPDRPGLRQRDRGPDRGFVERLPGVSGRALRFDGATTHVRRDGRARRRRWTQPSPSRSGWPCRPIPGTGRPSWSRRARRSPGARESSSRASLSASTTTGRVGLKVAVAGALRECLASAPLPHLEWTHVAGTFHRDHGLSLFVDGERVCSLAEGGTITPGDRRRPAAGSKPPAPGADRIRARAQRADRSRRWSSTVPSTR